MKTEKSALVEFFVATTGGDDNPGTGERPFATVERARDAVRQARRAAGTVWRGATVWLAGGLYQRRATFELTAADSGSADAPLVIRALPGETARLVGGVRVPRFTKVTDTDFLSRFYEHVREHLWEADLSGLGIADFGTLSSRGFGRSPAAAHMELFFNQQPMTLARWPNAGGFVPIAGVPAAGLHDDGHGTMIGRLENGFFYEGDQPRRWRNHGDIWIHGYWTYDWANSYERLESIDLELRHITTAAPRGHYGFLKGQRIYFVNVLEELDAPGEYYIDARRQKLYFRPPAPVNEGEAILSVLAGPLARVVDAAHVQFGPGLVLEAGRAAALEINGGHHCVVDGCTVRNTGTFGIACREGRHHQVCACDIHFTGDGGVSVSGGSRQTLEPAGHVVENCHFHDIGRWSKCYVPAILMEGVGLRAAHNLIHEHPHCAILFGGNEHVIE
ncbi:right-handed parallel beta-helix repeat-containing protein, partial [bacterium]|nr:right-handed parallel beta-helix repeat-containing protein [bacterium]